MWSVFSLIFGYSFCPDQIYIGVLLNVLHVPGTGDGGRNRQNPVVPAQGLKLALRSSRGLPTMGWLGLIPNLCLLRDLGSCQQGVTPSATGSQE